MTLVVDDQWLSRGMDIAMERSLVVVMFALAVLCVAMPVSGQLVPMSFGFPTAVQSSSSTGWVQDTADSVNFQDASVNFPTAGGLPLGPVSLGFPSIHQTSLQTTSMSHTEFLQTNDFAAIGYPFISVGAGGFSCGI